jgi:hypothetical protein
VEVKTDSTGKFSLEVTDIPPTPNEDWMPPLDSLLYQVLFYYKSSFDSAGFWESETKRWAKEVDHFAEPTRTIQEAVAGLISASDNELDKARKLYKAVQALDNTDFSRQKGKVELKQLGLRAARRAEDTLTQKSGSSKDITLLYLAMLRAAGLTAYDMKVVNRDRGIFAPGYLSFAQLDDDIVILNTGGKEVALDPGEKMCPFQTVSWKHSGAGGVRESAGGRAAGGTSPIQDYTSNELKRLGTIHLDEHGGMTGTFRFIMTGQEALHWRQQAILNDEAEVKKRFDRMLEGLFPEGVEGHIDHFLGLDDPDSNLIVIIQAKGTIGTGTAKRLLLPGFFFEVRGHRPFVDQSQRQISVDMHYGDRVIDQVVYQFPPTLSVEGAPQDSRVPWADQAALITKVIKGTGQVTIARSLSKAFTFLKPEQYQDLRAFYQKVDANDQQQLVLSTSQDHKGN